MEEDGFSEGLAQTPEYLQQEWFELSGGVKYWPNLAYALTIGYRPMMLDLRTPAGDGPHPVVVYIHGGAWYLGTPKYSNQCLADLKIEERLLEAGYAIARISYRLTAEAKWPAQLHDCKAAIRYLRSQAQGFRLDPNRVAVMGESAGGHLASMVGLTGNNVELEGSIGVTQGSSAVQAVVNWYGASDLARFRSDGTRAPMVGIVDLRPEDLLLGDEADADATLLLHASPIAHVTEEAPPFLHQHGDTDRLVVADHSAVLHQLLLNAGRVSELDIIEGADHCFWGATSDGIMDRVIEFLNQHLR